MLQLIDRHRYWSGYPGYCFRAWLGICCSVGEFGNAGELPASVWQWQEFDTFMDIEMTMTGALYQSSFGTSYPKPTRFAGRLQGLQELVYVGRPSYDERGRYAGAALGILAHQHSRTAGDCQEEQAYAVER